MNDYEKSLIDELENPTDLMDSSYEGSSFAWSEENIFYSEFCAEDL